MNRLLSLRVAGLACLPALAALLVSCEAPPQARPVTPLSFYDSRVRPLLARMTLDEKIGQMTQANQDSVKNLSDIESLFLGSVLSGGNSDPEEGNTLQNWTDLYDRFQRHTQRTRLKIPILYGIDAVHGHNNLLGAVIFPHNIGLGCTRNGTLVQLAARATAEEVRATGIQWAFAPCVAVPQDIRWGRTYEGFSENPQLVQALGEAAVWGLQGNDLADPLAVLACAKHYVGDGGTAYGSGTQGPKILDQGDTRVDEATLRRVHLPGYIPAIKAGVGSIMPSYSSWNGVKCSASKRLLTEILKQELGFQGFLISDYAAIEEIDPNYKKAVGISVNAGMDMAMEPNRYREFIADLKALVAEGVVPMARIDDAVTRILRVKFAMGLLTPGRSQLADRSLQKTFGSPEHRKVAREAVRQSLVLLQNRNHVLPIARNAPRIYVSGKSMDDLGNQCGGWTISWQGASGNPTPGGTTVLAAIRKAVSRETRVTDSRQEATIKGATVGVVVIGERPYAETKGDRAQLNLDREDIAAVNRVKAAGVPVVVVLISGRPMVLGEVLDKADAIVAAWLPGTEGDGVADVLFGDYRPTGKLSYTWPRAAVGSEALFPFGFGLSY